MLIQQWKFVRVRGGYYIQNVKTSKFLGIHPRNNTYGMEDTDVSNKAHTFAFSAKGDYWVITYVSLPLIFPLMYLLVSKEPRRKT